MHVSSIMHVCPEAGQNSYMVGSGSFIVANAATLHGPQVKPNKRILVWLIGPRMQHSKPSKHFQILSSSL